MLTYRYPLASFDSVFPKNGQHASTSANITTKGAKYASHKNVNTGHLTMILCGVMLNAGGYVLMF